MKNIRLVNWHIFGELVALYYSDGTMLCVTLCDFNRAFGTILSSSKKVVERDFATPYIG